MLLDRLNVFCHLRPDISVFLSVLLFGRIPTLTARTCYINERVLVSGHINERDHSIAIRNVKVACGILLDTATGTVTQRVCTDTAKPHLQHTAVTRFLSASVITSLLSYRAADLTLRANHVTGRSLVRWPKVSLSVLTGHSWTGGSEGSWRTVQT